MKRDKTFIKAFSITITLVALAALFLLFANEEADKENAYVGSANVTTTIDLKEYLEKDNIQTVCVVGLDSYDQNLTDGYMNAQMADFIYLLILDNEEKTITPVHINRDSMVNYHILSVNGTVVTDGYGQIALSHTYGDGGVISLLNVRDAVSSLFYDAYIDYAISLTMDALPIVNDKLGGVDIYVDYDFSESDPSIIYGQVNHLVGKQALTFVRARGSMEDKTNLTRMKRQRIYLEALYNKFILESNKDDEIILNTLNAIKKYMVTNALVTQIESLLNNSKEYTLMPTIVLEGEAIKSDTYMEYYLDEEFIKDVAIRYLFEECK